MSDQNSAPVLLLHGWGGSFTSTWEESGWIRDLADRGRKVIALDLPGHGPGKHSNDSEFYGDMASLVRQKLPKNTQMDAIGFSLGSKLLLALASAEPARFRKIVIGGLGANVFAPEQNGYSVAEALEAGIPETTPPQIAALAHYALAAGNDPLAVAAVLRRPPNPVLNPRKLSFITSPALVICGSKDSIAMPVTPLSTCMNNSVERILNDVDHLSLPKRIEFKQEALTFISR